eukprot:TRINITY_DN1992_c0_g3_i3.p1 TRINITY_DN1992_c0_g3~~TRINITY_DN1992_c0_g3_i3.p1  ORF type:complete len:280 (-),score=62.64 TRINITY_DN1992_c0_g3_i3:250-1089(-)
MGKQKERKKKLFIKMLLKLVRPFIQIAKVAGKQLLKTPLNYAPALYFSQLEKIETSQVKLTKAIEREIKYEKENYEVDASVKDFLKQQNLELIDQENESTMKLIKRNGQYRMTISFIARSPPAPEDEEQQQGAEKQQAQQQIDGQKKGNELEKGQQQEDEIPELADYCDFTVAIQKENQKNGIIYECSTYDSELTIHNINIVPAVEDYLKKSRYDKLSVDYNGPEYQTLDERLQTALLDHLKSFGVNEEVTAFIEHLSLDKEQRLYIKWLGDIKKYLDQ